jgi:PhnB protein
MVRLTPYLLFDGNCAEAMRFYQTCFGGDLMLIRLADTPMKAAFPEEKHSRISYAQLKSDAVEFSATDWLHPTETPKQGNTTAIYVNGAPGDDLKTAFDKLAEGAWHPTFTPLREMPFGLYGHLRDRYGVEWFFRGEKANA